MQESPCKSCETMCSEEKMCDKWREWYAGAWDLARHSLGVCTPKEGSGKKEVYTYEIRDTESGEVLCRGRAKDCAEALGVDTSSVRRAGANGWAMRKKLRVTRINVGGEMK